MRSIFDVVFKNWLGDRSEFFHPPDIKFAATILRLSLPDVLDVGKLDLSQSHGLICPASVIG